MNFTRRPWVGARNGKAYISFLGLILPRESRDADFHVMAAFNNTFGGKNKSKEMFTNINLLVC